MGFSWSLQGKIKVPATKLAALRAAAVDPSRHEWPDTWGEPNGADAMTFGEVIAELEQADAHAVRWTKTGVNVVAVFSNDSHLWLDLRSHLLATALVAADFGGEGDVAVTGFVDGGPDDVYRASANKKSAAIEVLTASEAKKVEKRIHAACESIVDKMLDDLEEAVPTTSSFEWPPDVLAVHARVCAALAEHPEGAITQAIKTVNLFAGRGKDFGRFEALFPGAALLPALRSGWPKMNQQMASRVAAAALAALGELDAKAARAIAADATALTATTPQGALVVEPLVAEARALATSTDSVADVERALAAMREAIPKQPHFMLHTQLAEHPALRVLRKSKAQTVHDATARALAALTDDGRELGDADQVYVYALTLVLERSATDEDREKLFRLWTDSPGFMLLDHHRVLAQGAAGKRYMASLYGRATRSQYAAQEQVMAARAKLELDSDGAIEVTRNLLATERTHTYAFALSGLFETLGEGAPRAEWTAVLDEAASQAGDEGLEALATLAKWKHRGVAPRVLERLEDGTLDVDRACSLLEISKDPSVKEGLERYAEGLAKNALRQKNRVKQCLRALG